MKKRAIFKTALIVTLLSVGFFAFAAHVSANESGTSALDDLYKEIPDEVRELLPDGIGDADAGELSELTGADYIFGAIWRMIKDAFFPAAGFFSTLLSTVLISSALNLFSRDISGGRLAPAVSLMTCVTLAVCTSTWAERLIGDVASFSETLSTFTAATVPMMAGLLSATGNASGAAVSSSGLLLFSAAVGYAVTYLFVPLFRLGFAFSVMGAVTGDGGDGAAGVGELIKKTFTWLSVGAATIFSTVLSYQTSLAASADTLAARGIKYTVGSAVPVVGGALSDAVRTAAAGLSVIKNGAGTVGIVVLILLVCPLLISLTYAMFSLGAASFAAGILGCGRESRLLSDIRSVLGFASAIVVMISFVFIFAVALYIKTAPALSAA